MIQHIPAKAFCEALDVVLRNQSTPIYDAVPRCASLPYMTYGEISIEPAGTKDLDICDVSIDLYIWSDFPGKKECFEIFEDVAAAFSSYQIDMRNKGYMAISQYLKTATTVAKDENGFSAIVTLGTKIQYIGG